MAKTFRQSFLGSAIRYTAAILIPVSVLLILIERTHWVYAAWGGLVWILLNSLAVFSLLEQVQSTSGFSRRKIVFLCLVKFPVLYIAGFVLILLPQTAAEGVLVVFSIFLILVLTSWLVYSQTKEKKE